MTEAAKAKRAEYLRAWRARNPDKVKAYEEAKWERKAKLAEESQSEK